MQSIGQIKIIGNGRLNQIVEKSFFLKENIFPIHESGHLNFVENKKNIFNNFDVLIVNGHTELK